MTENKKIKNFKEGEIIIEKGDPADHAFIVISGQASAYIKKGGKQIELGAISAGEMFGESALFDGEEYGAIVEAKTDVDVEVLDREDLNEIINSADVKAQALLGILMKRLKVMNDKLVDRETKEFMDLGFVERT